jgi:SAM-dependent methyltransferase
LELFTEIKANAVVDAAAKLVRQSYSARSMSDAARAILNALLLTKFGTVTGVDIAPAMVERARATNPGATYELYDGSRLPFEDDSFDVTFSICVFHHVDRASGSNAARSVERSTSM